jgi:hypothetical protein
VDVVTAVAPVPRRARRRVGYAALIVVLALAAVGPGIGWLWTVLSPRLPVMKVDGGYVYVDAEPEQVIAAEGWFAMLAAGAGLLLAILVWLLARRQRGVVLLVALAVGSLAGAWLAWYVGYKIAYAQFLDLSQGAAVGARLNAPLSLRITDLDPHALWPPKLTGVVVIQALVATFVYTLLAGFSAHPGLRGPDLRQVVYHPVPEPEPAYDPYWSSEPQFGPGRTGSSDSASGTARI